MSDTSFERRSESAESIIAAERTATVLKANQTAFLNAVKAFESVSDEELLERIKSSRKSATSYSNSATVFQGAANRAGGYADFCEVLLEIRST